MAFQSGPRIVVCLGGGTAKTAISGIWMAFDSLGMASANTFLISNFWIDPVDGGRPARSLHPPLC
jgi:hypothetical protein